MLHRNLTNEINSNSAFIALQPRRAFYFSARTIMNILFLLAVLFICVDLMCKYAEGYYRGNSIVSTKEFAVLVFFVFFIVALNVLILFHDGHGDMDAYSRTVICTVVAIAHCTEAPKTELGISVNNEPVVGVKIDNRAFVRLLSRDAESDSAFTANGENAQRPASSSENVQVPASSSENVQKGANSDAENDLHPNFRVVVSDVQPNFSSLDRL